VICVCAEQCVTCLPEDRLTLTSLDGTAPTQLRRLARQSNKKVIRFKGHTSCKSTGRRRQGCAVWRPRRPLQHCRRADAAPKKSSSKLLFKSSVHSSASSGCKATAWMPLLQAHEGVTSWRWSAVSTVEMTTLYQSMLLCPLVNSLPLVHWDCTCRTLIKTQDDVLATDRCCVTCCRGNRVAAMVRHASMGTAWSCIYSDCKKL
jgi:hypothetical protein